MQGVKINEILKKDNYNIKKTCTDIQLKCLQLNFHTLLYTNENDLQRKMSVHVLPENF